ncbi:hypothetical protein D515_00396 [Grimontia indica]|uniref:Uncharacterized protein n=1 Tax=Grimontia indica TaxID=1056512 RepID=R1ISP3_9GAMM|nr:hypothetical protein D515_00396 [Grimontia indica]
MINGADKHAIAQRIEFFPITLWQCDATFRVGRYGADAPQHVTDYPFSPE